MNTNVIEVKRFNSNKDIMNSVVNLSEENTNLRNLVRETLDVVIRQTSEMTVLREEVELIKTVMHEIKDQTIRGYEVTNEIKHKKFYGQKAELLPSAVEKAEKMSGSAVRALIHSAAKAHVSGRRKGYTYIYEKLLDVTGFNVYEVGQITLKKSDKIDGWRKDKSYINAILKNGKAREAAVICMQIKAGK